MSFNNGWEPLLSRQDLQQADVFIGIGASVLSETEVPFTRTVAQALGKKYIEFSDNGISNETIFRYISYANLKYSNAIIMPVFTYLVREELVDTADIVHIAMPRMLDGKNGRIKQAEMFYGYIWNEQQSVARFWNRMYDSKQASKQSNNIMISVWDSASGYDDNIALELNKPNLGQLLTDEFKAACIDRNAFREFYLETLERSAELNFHMTQESHRKLANILLKGSNND